MLGCVAPELRVPSTASAWPASAGACRPRRRHAAPIVTATSRPQPRLQPASRWAEPLLQCSASPAPPVSRSNQHSTVDARGSAPVAQEAGAEAAYQHQLTAATTAAQASTAHAAAKRAASEAQSASSSGRDPARQQQQQPLRDAFSHRDAFQQHQPIPAGDSSPVSGAAVQDASSQATGAAAQSAAPSPGASPARGDGGITSGQAAGPWSARPDPGIRSGAAPAGGSSGGGGGGGASGSGGEVGSHGHELVDLLGGAEDDRMGQRARSASDANVLRRKGHLKEQDSFISFLLRMHEMHSCLEVMTKMERWITEHRRDPRGSQLSRMVPSVGSFFTPLKLVDAFLEYDEFFALSRRKYVSPNFAEMRHVLNIAQVHASASLLKLVTFDADGTLYADGAHMAQDNRMIQLIIDLMNLGVHVAIVTAAGYPGDAERFEQRVQGLLEAFRQQRLPDHITDRFHMMGGECNYLLRVGPAPQRHLEFVPDGLWKSDYMMGWRQADIDAVLDEAGSLLQSTAAHLRLPVQMIRKERSVGVKPLVPTIYEVLEELAITVQAQLGDRLPLPFCAFNGGADVFVDLGNKSLGLEAMMNFLKIKPHQAMHVGDRFTSSGNDRATRDCCCILWVANPDETIWFIGLLRDEIHSLRRGDYIE